MLRGQHVITEKECAEKMSLLCEWNVQGLFIYFKDILILISEDFSGNEDSKQCIDILNNNKKFMSIINYLWILEKDYEKLLAGISNFITFMISSKSKIFVQNNIIAAIWYKWIQRVKFHKKAESNMLNILSRIFISVSMQLINKNRDRNFNHYSSKLWEVYNCVIYLNYGSSMSNTIEKKSIQNIGIHAGKSSHDPVVRDYLFQFISSSLAYGSKERDLFNQSYVKSVVEFEK
ncbi:MAG: hypothetical protein ACFFD5_17220 [Candidatus Thorarchaeota archaeon]